MGIGKGRFRLYRPCEGQRPIATWARRARYDRKAAMKKTRIVLADPQPLVRGGLRRLIEDVPGTEVCAEVASGRELLEAVVELRPEVVVTELSLTGLSGIDVTRRLMRHMPSLHILVISAELQAPQVKAALRAGVAGYVSKSAEVPELRIALKAVADGLPYLSPNVAKHAFERRKTRRSSESVILSTRQREVLQLVGRGKSTKEIAALLGVSVKTVETHRLRLMQALDLSNINALVHFATRQQFEAGALE